MIPDPEEPHLPTAVAHDNADRVVYALKKFMYQRKNTHHRADSYAAEEVLAGIMIQMPRPENPKYKLYRTEENDEGWDDGQIPELAFGYKEVPWKESEVG